jgi:hypothetical protein
MTEFNIWIVVDTSAWPNARMDCPNAMTEFNRDVKIPMMEVMNLEKAAWTVGIMS